ncbi:MAG: hypothetical protein GY816_09815 [Cytophagales bacterium]|nr:hypothetical protein [Cytophagales bacterium]
MNWNVARQFCVPKRGSLRDKKRGSTKVGKRRRPKKKVWGAGWREGVDG